MPGAFQLLREALMRPEGVSKLGTRVDGPGPVAKGRIPFKNPSRSDPSRSDPSRSDPSRSDPSRLYPSSPKAYPRTTLAHASTHTPATAAVALISARARTSTCTPRTTRARPPAPAHLLAQQPAELRLLGVRLILPAAC